MCFHGDLESIPLLQCMNLTSHFLARFLCKCSFVLPMQGSRNRGGRGGTGPPNIFSGGVNEGFTPPIILALICNTNSKYNSGMNL